MKIYNVADNTGDISETENGPIVTLTASKTLDAGDSGKTILIGTDALAFTLPPTVKGFEVTFVNTGVAGNNIISVTPSANDGVSGTITLAATVVVRPGTLANPLVNTKATSKTGDTIKLIGTGVPGAAAYLIVASTGIWA